MTQNAQTAPGLAELREERAKSKGLYWFVAIFSMFVNLLMLTGPLYMLQVYDRVLGSRSVETLLALTILVVFLYGMMGILDYARGRVMARAAARFQSGLDRRVFSAVLRGRGAPGSPASTGLQDLDAVQRLISSPVLMAIFDMPWTPIFIAGIFLFHPWLGILATVGGVVLIVVTLFNQWLTREPIARTINIGRRAELLGEKMRTEGEMIQALGMRGAAFDRWSGTRDEAMRSALGAQDVGGGFTATTKSFRLFLQSAMLGLGALLVLRGELTPGAMIAGSILMGRALAPIELAIGQWAVVQRARQAWGNLAQLLTEIPAETPKTPLPRPAAKLELSSVTVIPPGEQQAALRMITMALAPGQACGVIGPSGAGKSTLARAITGVWRPAGGKIRLDGASLDNYDPDVLGGLIGYLPQSVSLFDGTIAENIARLQPDPEPQAIHDAARRAAAHEMILRLPDGYDTRVAALDGRLSGGQVQRIGLARALYGDPVMVVLDEPNSNLDNEGNVALNTAIRELKAAGKIVIIMAHRPAAIEQCDMLLMLENGQRRAFGPKDEVLKQVLANHRDVAQATPKAAGVT
ncbi:MAG: type I secretion system permease/ATPase [Shimia sp.]